MASQSDHIENAVKEALEQIQKNAPAEYAKLTADSSQKEKVIEAARTAASETLKLNDEFAGKPGSCYSNNSSLGKPQKIEERLAKHLSHDRIKLIKEGLNIPTFRLEIAMKQDTHLLMFTRQGEQFLPERNLASRHDIEWGKVMQYTSIVYEAILLAMSVGGVSLSPSQSTMREACRKMHQVIGSSSVMRRALDAFVKAWKAAGSIFEKAKALFDLLKNSYAANIFWNAVKLVCNNMSWFEWVIAAVKFIAMLVAAFASGGAALIAKITLAVVDAVKFAEKIANINQLSLVTLS